MNVAKGLRKVLRPPELMVWIHCGLGSCGLDKGINVVKGLRKLLHPSELMVWINCGLDSCGLDKHENYHLSSTTIWLCIED